MPIWLRPLFYYLWVAPHVLLFVLLVLLFRRGLHRRFPVFCGYVGFQIVEWIVLLGIYWQTGSFSTANYHIYISVDTIGSAALRFAVLDEIFKNIFRNQDSLRALGTQFLRWTAAGLLLAGAILASLSGSAGFFGLFWVFDRTISLLQCGLLVSLLFFSRYFAIPWRDYAFGLALGFGIYESIELINAAVRSRLSSGSYLLDTIGMAAYHLCVLIWILYLWVPSGPTPAKTVPGDDHDIESWNRELRRLLQQ